MNPINKIIKGMKIIAGVNFLYTLALLGIQGISQALKTSEKEYGIFLSSEAKESTLRHELYHIAGGHCDNEYNLLKYYFIQEPKATIYQITGLKP